MNPTVLVCDDAPYMRDLLKRILERGGFAVVGEADSGSIAIQKVQELRPDVVTLDIVMRDMSGLEAVRSIRALSASIGILMCSAMAQPALVAEAIEAGANEFVVKPFGPSALLEAMQRVVDLRPPRSPGSPRPPGSPSK